MTLIYSITYCTSQFQEKLVSFASCLIQAAQEAINSEIERSVKHLIPSEDNEEDEKKFYFVHVELKVVMIEERGGRKR